MTGAKDRTFILSESGHIAGIVNPPSRRNTAITPTTTMSAGVDDGWPARTYHEGLVVAALGQWLASDPGKKVARAHAGRFGEHPPLAPAPGAPMSPATAND